MHLCEWINYLDVSSSSTIWWSGLNHSLVKVLIIFFFLYQLCWLKLFHYACKINIYTAVSGTICTHSTNSYIWIPWCTWKIANKSASPTIYTIAKQLRVQYISFMFFETKFKNLNKIGTNTSAACLTANGWIKILPTKLHFVLSWHLQFDINDIIWQYLLLWCWPNASDTGDKTSVLWGSCLCELFFRQCYFFCVWGWPWGNDLLL